MANARKIPQVLWKRIRVVIQAWKSEYRYAARDYLGYLCFGEYPGFPFCFPSVDDLGSWEGFNRFCVNGQVYYWPATVSLWGMDWVYQEVFAPASCNFHAYEYGKVRIRPGDQVVDAGAGEGFFTRYALMKNANLLAIEPVAEIAEALKHTFASEIVEGRVKVLPVALGSASGVVNFLVDRARPFEGRIGSEGIPVPVKSLDRIVGDQRVDFIKMDIEGAEVDAVLGAEYLIRSQKPRLSIAVYHAWENARDISRLLRHWRPDYHIVQRGIYAWGGGAPRPFMLYAW